MVDVDVDNVGPLINRLNRFDKDVYRILQKEIRQGAEVVAADARPRVPARALSGWGTWNLRTGRSASIGAVALTTGSRDLSYDGGAAKRSVKPSSRITKNRARGVTGIEGRVVMGNPGGAIWALAGSRNASGSAFNRNLKARFGLGPWPRALAPALQAKGPQAIKRIDAAIQRAADAVT